MRRPTLPPSAPHQLAVRVAAAASASHANSLVGILASGYSGGPIYGSGGYTYRRRTLPLPPYARGQQVLDALIRAGRGDIQGCSTLNT